MTTPLFPFTRIARGVLVADAVAREIAAGRSQAKAAESAAKLFSLTSRTVARAYQNQRAANPDAPVIGRWTRDGKTGRNLFVTADRIIAEDPVALPFARVLAFAQGPELLLHMEKFPTAEACYVALERARWPEGVRCLGCDSPEVARMARRRSFQCRTCRKQFTAATGTPLERAHVPVRVWFAVLHLVDLSQGRVEPSALAKVFGISWKAAVALRLEAAAVLLRESQ